MVGLSLTMVTSLLLLLLSLLFLLLLLSRSEEDRLCLILYCCCNCSCLDNLEEDGWGCCFIFLVFSAVFDLNCFKNSERSPPGCCKGIPISGKKQIRLRNEDIGMDRYIDGGDNLFTL